MLKQINFKTDFYRIEDWTGNIIELSSNEVDSEIQITMSGDTEEIIIKKIDDCFQYYEKSIFLQTNGDIIKTIKGKFCRISIDLDKYLRNIKFKA